MLPKHCIMSMKRIEGKLHNSQEGYHKFSLFIFKILASVSQSFANLSPSTYEYAIGEYEALSPPKMHFHLPLFVLPYILMLHTRRVLPSHFSSIRMTFLAFLLILIVLHHTLFYQRGLLRTFLLFLFLRLVFLLCHVSLHIYLLLLPL